MRLSHFARIAVSERMRMIRRIMVVAVVAMSIGLVALVAPSGGATAGETCKQLDGIVSFKPPLPPGNSNTRVPLKITTMTGTNLVTCTGPAGLRGSLALTVTSPTTINCKIVAFSGFPKTTKGTGTIKWAKGKPSTLAVTLTWSKASSYLKPQLTGGVTAGQFKGLAASATLSLSPYRGNCVSTALSSMRVNLASGSRFVLTKPLPPTTTTTTTSTTTTSTTTTTSMPATTTTEESTTTTSTP
jgi:hypothetical protein